MWPIVPVAGAPPMTDPTSSSSSARLRDLRTRLEGPILVLDGAMGTQLYERGLTFQDSFDAANLDRPELVLEVHRAYVEAGAEGLLTNTFGANRYRLERFHRQDALPAILEAGAHLAREAAGEDRWVLGSVGPLGVEIEPIGRLEKAEARVAFQEVAASLDPLVDGFCLETFTNLEEAVQAIHGIREASDKAILAHVTVDASGRTIHGNPVEVCARWLEEAGADVIGLNCTTGPRLLLDNILRMADFTVRPLSARPNAGVPRVVEGRVFYESNPDYFARFARRFLQAGGRVLGGCCGTTPAHVQAMVRSARMARSQGQGAAAPPLTRSRHAVVQVPEQRPLRPVPLAERSRLGRALTAGSCPTSVELLPPRKPDMERMCAAAARIRDSGATVINIPDGPRASARISSLAAATILQQRVGVETLLHFCCRDRNLLGMQSDLMGAAALDVRNILVVTGDPPYVGNYPAVTAVFDVDSIGLCNIVDNLNHGLDLGGNEVGAQTHFCFGAALNPTALDPEQELHRFHWKIQAGIDFAITQPVFDVEGFLAFLERLPGERPPILAGIWPLRSLRNAEFLAAEVPGVRVPAGILERMQAAESRGRAREEGVAIARETVAALADKVQGFQVAAPFNDPAPALAVLAAVHERFPAPAD